MGLLTSLVHGLRHLFRRADAERDLGDEIDGFLAESVAEKMRGGLARAEATRRARVELGSVSAVKETVRGGGWEAVVEGTWRDLAYGARALRRNPGFTAVAVLTLALGIGANSAMFSVVNGVILRPLPYASPRDLVMLWTDDVKRGIHESATGIPTLEDWRAESRLFSNVAIYRRNGIGITSPGEPERVRSVFAEPRLLPLLGVQPALGRTFTDAENEHGEAVAVISWSLWQRRFAAGDVLDQVITLDGDLTAWKRDPRAVRVIGVMPRDFYFPDKTVDVWEPMRTYFRYDEEARDRLNYSAYQAVARLQPGVTPDAARAALAAVGRRLESIHPSPAKNFPGYVPAVVPALDEVAGRDLQRALWTLLGTVAFVLLIACVNVANLLLARGATREREIGIRLAIGAGRGRILRQLLIESALLAAIAGAVGLAVAGLGIRALVAAAPPGLPRLDELSIDGTVLLYTLGASMAAALAFGLAPAWRFVREPAHESIRMESAGTTGARRNARLRGMLVVAECALAVVLLAGAGLLLRSVFHVNAVDPGFRADHVLVVRVNPSPSIGAGTATTQLRFTAQEESLDETLTRIRAIPGVVAAGVSGELMMSGEPDESITLDGEPYDASAHRSVRLNSIGVSPGFLEAMGVPLRRGRWLTRDDEVGKIRLLFTSMTPSYRGPAEAAVVNEAFVKQFLPGRDPLGARFWMGHPGKPYWYEVVGVVGDMHRQGLERDAVPEYFGSASGTGGDIVVRTTGNPLTLAAAVRGAIHAVDPGAAVRSVSTAAEQLGSFSAQRKFQAWLLALFAAIALPLAAIGIYGVMRFAVATRAREIGVRVALGASGSAVVRLVLTQGLALAATGVLVGVAGALALTGLLSHWLFGVTATDPLTFGSVVAVLLGASALACWLPARRAAAVDPMVVLRQD